MKKVLHIIRNISDGGTERFMRNILKGTNDKYTNIIVTYESINNLDSVFDNIKIIQIDEPSKIGLVKTVKNLKKIMQDNSIDIVYSYTHFNSGYVMLAAFMAGVDIRITHSHRTESNGRKDFKYRLYKSFSKLLINIFSNIRLACGKEAGRSLFYKFNNFIVINNGIEIDKYKFDENKRLQLRKQYGIPNDCIVIGTVGRLDDNKNQKFLINVFSEYHKNNNSKLVIIGDGENRKSLEIQVKKLQLTDAVIFMGSRSDVNEYYNMLDLFILTSFNEGLPFVLIEAQTNGLKCLVSDSVSRDANINNMIVYKSLEEPINDWCVKLEQIDLKRIDSLNKLIEKGYSLENTIKKIEEIYDKN